MKSHHCWHDVFIFTNTHFLQARELLESVDAAASDKEPDKADTDTDKAKAEEGEDDAEKKEEGEKENGEGEKKKEEEKEEEKEKIKELEELVQGELADLRRESRRLHNLVTQLHQRHHEHTLQVSGREGWGLGRGWPDRANPWTHTAGEWMGRVR